ncbi:AsmA-like C-terminal region-containing protein [uncultured Marinobacter sp.]|uniref:YhdP family phospholipid transporter n=1 Tax=uncultured Marinobacter sp. TaxID=187379 RepID=UPI0026359F7C|nr:AsmA-like C-terminal region-containing protein [uncultured Marinobacter sp.]
MKLRKPSSDSQPLRLMALLTNAIWWLLLVVLVLLALYAGIGRQLTQNVDSFRDELSDELSARLGHDVSIGSLSSRWFWLDPSFTAQDIEVTNPDSGDRVVSLQHLTIRFDALASLMRFRIVFEDFEADGLELTLNQQRSGEVGVRGADIPEPLNNRYRDWLRIAGKWLSDPYIKVTRVNLGIRDNQGQLRFLDIPQLDLLYQQGLFRASGRALRSATTEQLASFALVGKQFFRGDFSGQLYLNVDSGRLFDGLIDEYQWRDIRIEGFDLGGEAWLTFRKGVLQQVSGTVRTPYLQLGVAGESLAPLEDISARFGWRRHHDVMVTPEEGGPRSETIGEWHLKQLAWTWNGDQVPPFSLKLVPEPQGITITADAMPLRPLRRLTGTLPLLPPVASDALEDYRPVGFLDGVTIRVPGSGDNSFELSAQLRDVGAAAYGGAPAVRGVNGFIYVDQNAGYVRAREGSRPVALSFPELFSSEWSLPELSATVAWRLDGPVTRVYSDDIRMTYGDNTHLSGAFDLKLDQTGEDNLGLRVSVENGDASMLAAFVPEKIVDAGLYEWLTTAITEAEIPSGVYYGHGQIGRDAPSGSFVSSMWYEFENASVRYDKQWPEVTDARGRVDIQNGDTLVMLEAGNTGGLAIDPSTVSVIPEAEGALVRVDVSAPVPADAISYWMSNSPFGAMAGPEAAKLSYGGEYKLDLSIDLPLKDNLAPVVEAGVRTENGSVAYPGTDLRWDRINGELTYHSEKGFSKAPLMAHFLDEPTKIVFSQPGAAQALRIEQTGTLPVLSVFRQFERVDPQNLNGSDAGSSRYGLKGAFGYSARLDVTAEGPPRVTVRSSLEGLTIDWPGPFSKKAGQVAPVFAEIHTGDERGLGISGTWENRATFDLLWKNSGIELTFDELYLGDQILKNIELEAFDLGDRWVLSTHSERAVGRIEIPNDNSLVTADFAVVQLVRDETAAKEAPELLTIEQQLEAFRAMDMEAWPDVDIAIAELRLNNDRLGRWAFQLRPERQKLNIRNIEGHLESITLLGDMTWSVVDDREVSQFAGSIAGGALADLGELFDTEVPFSNKQSNIELNLDWPGRPDEFDPASLSGNVSLRLDDGVILESNNSAQVFRIFNLLNSDTLWRRLKLDFSDLYERGVAFDAISGKARLEDGLLTMDPEMQVVGPSGAFKLSGSTNLEEEVFDMRLVVVLPLTQNLPLAALLMGAGAPIGGALFVLDKVLGDPLSRLTSATYNVTGPWDEPKVDLRSVFDTGK